MLLDICKESLLFKINHTAFIDFLCYLIIFVCFILCIYFYTKPLFKKRAKLKKIMIVFLVALVILFVSCIFVSTLNENNYKQCMCDYSLTKSIKNDLSAKALERRLQLNKIIIIGDSRMEFLSEDEEVTIPENVEFIAKSGSKIDWLEKSAIPILEEILDQRDSKYKYHVVVNMGVNDLNTDGDYIEIIENYYELYKSLALKYTDVSFYLLSINPIDDDLIMETNPNNKRTNEKIEVSNRKFKSLLRKDNNRNMSYCNSYSVLDFNTPDGLHYSSDTNQDIIDYITNKCVVNK